MALVSKAVDLHPLTHLDAPDDLICPAHLIFDAHTVADALGDAIATLGSARDVRAATVVILSEAMKTGRDAIADATGARVRDIPATPERVKTALAAIAAE